MTPIINISVKLIAALKNALSQREQQRSHVASDAAATVSLEHLHVTITKMSAIRTALNNRPQCLINIYYRHELHVAQFICASR